MIGAGAPAPGGAIIMNQQANAGTAASTIDVSALKHRHIAGVTIGNALEFYDFLVYAFFSIQIGKALFPADSAYASLMLSLATFGAGFLTRPLGALVIGAYSDRIGRKPAMLFCFAVIGISMVLMAVLPDYETIGLAAPILAVIIRMGQGFSLGGELGSNTAYLLEAAPLEKRGLIVSWQQASQLAAVMAASGVGAVLSLFMAPDMLDAYGWRIAFLLGAVTLPFGLWMRARLPETLHLAEPVAVTVAGPSEASRADLAKKATPLLALAIIILGCGSITNYLQIYMVTYAQNTLGMPASSAFWATMVAALIGIGATLWGGQLSDRFGRRPVNLLGTLALLLAIYPIFYAIIETRSTLVLIIGLALFVSLTNLTGGVFYASLAELLPKSIRGSAFGTVYAVAIAIFGGSTQLIVTWMIHTTGSPYAPAWLVLGVVSIWFAALLAIPESAPKKLAKTGLPLQPAI